MNICIFTNYFQESGEKPPRGRTAKNFWYYRGLAGDGRRDGTAATTDELATWRGVK
jgi:hypothetical protein